MRVSGTRRRISSTCGANVSELIVVWKTILTRGTRDQSKDVDLVEPVEDVVARGVEVLRVADDLAVIRLPEDREEGPVREDD